MSYRYATSSSSETKHFSTIISPLRISWKPSKHHVKPACIVLSVDEDGGQGGKKPEKDAKGKKSKAEKKGETTQVGILLRNHNIVFGVVGYLYVLHYWLVDYRKA